MSSSRKLFWIEAMSFRTSFSYLPFRSEGSARCSGSAALGGSYGESARGREPTTQRRTSRCLLQNVKSHPTRSGH